MKIEIERKFLVSGQSWRGHEDKFSEIIQGYFAEADGYVLRIRIIDGRALLTLKGKAVGISRSEFEYEVPLDDGYFMLKNFCGDRIVHKKRYYVPAANGRCWEIDEYFDKCQGLFTAEIELEHENEQFLRPDWLGEEVSFRPEYNNKSLAIFGLPQCRD